MDIFYIGEPVPPGPTIVNTEPVTAPPPAVIRSLGCWSLAHEPCPTSRAVAVNADFSVSGSVDLNIREICNGQNIDVVMSVYIANSGDNDIEILVNPVGQKMTCKAGEFGFFPVIATSDDQIILNSHISQENTRAILLNVLMPINTGTL